MSWPKGKPRPPEVRAKISATMKAKGIKPLVHNSGRARTRPLPGTAERKLFDRISPILGAAAAHAELRRGA